MVECGRGLGRRCKREEECVGVMAIAMAMVWEEDNCFMQKGRKYKVG